MALCSQLRVSREFQRFQNYSSTVLYVATTPFIVTYLRASHGLQPSVERSSDAFFEFSLHTFTDCHAYA
jgi:hypothetical protein